MSHVDEGLLHAYLDGAFETESEERREIEGHLATCADCRVRLDDARRTKGIAQQALDAVAPVEAGSPAWSDIVAEHARRRIDAGAAPRRRRSMPLAWAASLFVAVSAGWMARSLMRQDVGAPAILGENDSIALVLQSDAAPREEAMSADRVEAAPPEVLAPAPPERTVGGARSELETTARDARANAIAAGRRADSANLRLLEERQQVAASPPAAKALAGQSAQAPPAAASAFRLSDEASSDDATLVVLDTIASSARWLPADADSLAALPEPPASFEGHVPERIEHATLGDWQLIRATYALGGASVEVVQGRSTTAEEKDRDLRRQRAAEPDPPAIEGGRAFVEVRGWSVLMRGTPEAVRDIAARVR